MRILDLLLLASGVVLYAALALVLWLRRIYALFPLFWVYSIYAVAASAVRVVLPSQGPVYFYGFWGTELGFLLLSIVALHEVFRSVFEGFYLLNWFRWSYFGALGTVLCLAILNSIFNRPVQVHPLFRVILDVYMPINCILAAICGLFYVFVKVLSVSFRRYSFAIVLGFGISAIGTLIPFVLRSIFGKRLEFFVIYAPSVAYYVTLLVWISAFAYPEPADDHASPLPPEQMTSEVRQYTRVLKGFFGKSHES